VPHPSRACDGFGCKYSLTNRRNYCRCLSFACHSERSEEPLYFALEVDDRSIRSGIPPVNGPIPKYFLHIQPKKRMSSPQTSRKPAN